MKKDSLPYAHLAANFTENKQVSQGQKVQQSKANKHEYQSNKNVSLSGHSQDRTTSSRSNITAQREYTGTKPTKRISTTKTNSDAQTSLDRAKRNFNNKKAVQIKNQKKIVRSRANLRPDTFSAIAAEDGARSSPIRQILLGDDSSEQEFSTIESR